MNKYLCIAIFISVCILLYMSMNNIEKFINEPFIVKTSEPFVFWLRKYKNYNVQEKEFDKLFLLYNRATRPHRILLLSLLQKNNLLKIESSKGLFGLF